MFQQASPQTPPPKWEGLKFRRNVYILDEIMGIIKKEIQRHDEGRTGELERFGIKVLRFTNDQILHDCDLVVEKINATIIELTTTS